MPTSPLWTSQPRKGTWAAIQGSWRCMTCPAGRDVAFFLHALAPKADGDRQSIANFTAICDYIGKLHLTALAISQFCALSTT